MRLGGVWEWSVLRCLDRLFLKLEEPVEAFGAGLAVIALLGWESHVGYI